MSIKFKYKLHRRVIIKSPSKGRVFSNQSNIWLCCTFSLSVVSSSEELVERDVREFLRRCLSWSDNTRSWHTASTTSCLSCRIKMLYQQFLLHYSNFMNCPYFTVPNSMNIKYPPIFTYWQPIPATKLNILRLKMYYQKLTTDTKLCITNTVARHQNFDKRGILWEIMETSNFQVQYYKTSLVIAFTSRN